MQYGWFSARQARESLSSGRPADVEYDDLTRRRMTKPGLSVWSTPDRTMAVVTTMVTVNEQGTACGHDDRIGLGPVLHYVGNLPYGVIPERPLAVMTGRLSALMAYTLSDAEIREAERLAEGLGDKPATEAALKF